MEPGSSACSEEARFDCQNPRSAGGGGKPIVALVGLGLHADRKIIGKVVGGLKFISEAQQGAPRCQAPSITARP